MINIPTVLILGAGASRPFGFPTGPELVSQMVRNLRSNTNIQTIAGLTSSSEGEVRNFKDSLYKSQKISIDSFLEHRKEFQLVGKTAIAQTLISYEKQENLYAQKRNWYQYLFNKMNSSFEEFTNNKLSILTFNYDRSFENYMFSALKNSYGREDDEIAGAMKCLNIIHLHGQLGYLPWQFPTDSKNTRGYSAELLPENIRIAAKDIRIIHDDFDIDSDPEFNKARELVHACKRLILLGFGYDPVNVNRLNIDFSKIDKEIYGSCFGMEGEEVNNLSRKMLRNIEFGEVTDDNLSFLRKKDILTEDVTSDAKKQMIRKINIISGKRKIPEDEIKVAQFLRIVESLTLDEAAVLDSYARGLGSNDLAFPLSSRESIALCQDKLVTFKLLVKKVQPFDYRLTSFGTDLCGYLRSYDQL